jgi:hypothetical protein
MMQMNDLIHQRDKSALNKISRKRITIYRRNHFEI